jgi:hypothetical protein
VAGAENRQDFRGQDASRDAARDKASSVLSDRGADPAQSREKLQTVDREKAQQAVQNRGGDASGARDRAQSSGGALGDASQRRDQAPGAGQMSRDNARQTMDQRTPDNAFRDAPKGAQARSDAARGNSSLGSMQAHSGGSRPQASRPAGGGRAGGGGGGRRR